MKIFDTLSTLSDPKLNHRMIVHGIHGERVIIPLPLIRFLSSVAVERNDLKLAHSVTDFPIKEIILNRYNKKLTDEQYSALLTLLIHCRTYNGLAVESCFMVKYKSSNELKYDDKFKALLDLNMELAEAVYNIGFDTGEITIEETDYSVAQDILGFLTVSYVHALPDELFVADDAYEDAETMPFQE